MTWRNIKRGREEEDLELESKRHRKDLTKSDPSSAESMAPAKQIGPNDALSYLRLVRETFKEDESRYRDFLRILKQFQTGSIDTATLVSLVKTLFRAHPQLLLGLNEFLPKGHKIDDPEPEVVVVSSSCGKGRLSPSNQPAGQEDVAEQSSPEKRSESLQRALNFVHKVSRFCKEEHVYTGFLRILNLYKKGLEIEEVTRRISSLFVGHEDLVEEFAGFLPPCRKCGSSPACTLKEIIQANSGPHDQANGIPRKESGKRVTSPIDCYHEAGDLGGAVQEHSSPKGKKQCREEGKEVEVDAGPMHSFPCKKERTIDDEEETGIAVHTNHQELTTEEEDQTCLQDSPRMPNKQGQTTGMVHEENDKADDTESKEHLKGVEEPMDIGVSTELPNRHSPLNGEEEPMDTSVSPELPGRHSPLKVRIHRKESSIGDEESNTTDLSKSKDPSIGVGEEMNVGPIQKIFKEYSLRNIKKLHKRNEKLREEHGKTHWTASEDSSQEGEMLTDICSSQALPGEHSSPGIRKRQKKTAAIEEEKYTTHQSEKKKYVIEGVEEIGFCPSEKLSQELESPKLWKQSSEIEGASARQSESSESGKEEGDQGDICVSPKQRKVKRYRKRTDKTEEEDVVAGQSHARGMSQWKKTDKEEERKLKADDSESDESGTKAGERMVIRAPELPLKRTSARVARELIWKQCQATEARQSAKAVNLEEEQRRKRLQQVEDERTLVLQQKQHEFFEKVQENLKRSDNTKCFQAFCKEIFSCPELQNAVSEALDEQELEYSQCKKCTASYYLLPKSYLKPLTTHRKRLDRTVLNDNLVSTGFDDDSDENSHDESIAGRKQIRREGSGKRVPHDERLLHEENLFLCEDDQYELDLLRHTTASTIKKVEEMVEVTQGPGFCMEAFDWNEYLSPVHFRCMERIYGDYWVEFIEKAQENPIVALPRILGHLKQKEEEDWPKYQVEMNKYWAEAHAEHFRKSLDYSQTDTQDDDTVQVSMDSFPLEPSPDEDQSEDDSGPVADGGQEELTSIFSFKHPDLELMYGIIKHLLEEVHITEEQFEKVQTVWSVHVDSIDIVPDIDQIEETDMAGDTTESSQ